MQIKLLTGSTYGKLLVGKRLRDNSYECVCSCGTATICHANNLRNGNSKSCGCLRSIAKVGDKNPMWAGKDVCYAGIHLRIKQVLTKPPLCENCHLVPPIDLANKSDTYLHDISDWWYLCRRCHMTLDGRSKKVSDFQKSRKVKTPPCKFCGKEYYRKSGQRIATFCSRECFYKAGGKSWRKLIDKLKKERCKDG